MAVIKMKIPITIVALTLFLLCCVLFRKVQKKQTSGKLWLRVVEGGPYIVKMNHEMTTPETNVSTDSQKIACQIPSVNITIDENKDLQNVPGYQLNCRTPSKSFSLRGKNFTIKKAYLATAKIPRTDGFISLTSINVQDFVFVSGASSNHFSESTEAILRIQSLFPNHTLLYYDLGLTRTQKHKVQSWCNIKYMTFHFNKYPTHVKRLRTYAFKPLIINEVLQIYPGALWMDASVKFNTNHLVKVYDLAIQNGGFIDFKNTGAPVLSATNPLMLNYLPSDRQMLSKALMHTGGDILVYNTNRIYNGFFMWWCLCALTPDCIAPNKSKLACPSNYSKKIGKCHRYDQSALNLLVYNLFSFDAERFANRDTYACNSILRGRKSKISIPRVCKS